MNGIDDYDNYVVKKGIIRYKFIIVLFLLSLCIFHPETFDFVRKYSSIENTNTLLFIHGALFSSIVYIMLVYFDDSYIFSPCNIELELDDFLYYQGQNQKND